MIVGTPRSGTTLVQRLTCEVPGVRMAPETHFLSRFAPGLLSRHHFPLTGAALRDELARYARTRTSRSIGIRPDDIVESLGGRARSLLDLFSAIVRVLAGDARRVGEKTPEHLSWCGPVARAHPGLKVLWVVRDPRAVAASQYRVPWGIRSPAVLAEKWVFDVSALAALQRELGSGRLLAVRYEDVVEDAPAARDGIARWLHAPDPVPAAPADPIADGVLLQRWEWWKRSALEPAQPARAGAWRAELPARDAAVVAAIAAPAMEAWGYRDGLPETAERVAVLRDERVRFARGRFRTAWTRRLARIGSVDPASTDGRGRLAFEPWERFRATGLGRVTGAARRGMLEA